MKTATSFLAMAFVFAVLATLLYLTNTERAGDALAAITGASMVMAGLFAWRGDRS